LADALTAAQWVTATPHRARELIAIGDRILQRTSAADDPEFYFILLRSRITLLLQIGEVQEIERSLPELDRLDEMLNQPFLHWGVLVIHAMLAAAHGDLEQSERLSTAALAAGQQAQSVTATLAFAAQLIIIRLLQGRIGELEPAVTQFTTLYPALDIFDLVRAWIQMQSGASPDAVAPAFGEVARRGFASLSHDQLWLARISLLADLAWYTRNAPAAAELYELLRGYDGCAITVEAIAIFGSAARYLGRLAAAQGHWDDAERHFREALAMERTIAKPSVAWTCLYFAEMLLDRDAPGDRAEALALLQQVLDISQPLGLTYNINQAVALKLRAQGVASAGIYTSIDRVAEQVRAERPALPEQSVAPDGTVTIMFSDIEDSTVLTERLGDQRWRDVLQAHDDVVRGCVRDHGGFVVKHLGDGFMVAFQSARRALDCAIAIQRAFAGLSPPPARGHDGNGGAAAGAPASPIRVRIGLHAGETMREADDFFGKNVIVASRVAGKARGGEILVSDLLHRLVEPSVEPAVFSAREDVELKGLAGAFTLYAVDWAPAGTPQPS
jgi:class 3 adenylate cyclase